MPRQPKTLKTDPVPDEQTAIEAVSSVTTPAASSGTRPKVGDVVLCTSRLPSPLRPWENPIWIGVIEQPGSDPSRWNGKYSEAAYCVHTKKLKVRYRNPENPEDSFIQHDKVDSLIVLTADEAQLTGLDAIRHFLGLVAAHQYQRHHATKSPGEPRPEPDDDETETPEEKDEE